MQDYAIFVFYESGSLHEGKELFLRHLLDLRTQGFADVHHFVNLRMQFLLLRTQLEVVVLHQCLLYGSYGELLDHCVGGLGMALLVEKLRYVLT